MTAIQDAPPTERKARGTRFTRSVVIQRAGAARWALKGAALLAFFLASASANASAVGNLTFLNGDLTLKPGAMASYTIVVSDTMFDARLDIWLEVTKGKPKEIEFSVSTEWPAADTDTLVEDATFMDFDTGSTPRVREQRLANPGVYHAAISNPSWNMGSRVVTGIIRLSWCQDPRRSAAERMKARIRLLEVPHDSAMVIPVRCVGGTQRVIVEMGSNDITRTFTVERVVGQRISRRFAADYSCDYGPEIGVIDFDGDGNEEVLLVGTNGGSGGMDTDLALLLPSKAALVEPGGKRDRKIHGKEIAYLDSLRFAYQEHSCDWIQAGDDDPRFIFEMWARDNRGLYNGPVKVRKYPGLPFFWGGGSLLDTGDTVYVAEMKSGVVAYDIGADEHFGVYDPRDANNWVTKLENVEQFLIMYQGGDSIPVVDTHTFRLYRVPYETPDKEPIGVFELVNGRLMVRGSPLEQLMAREPRRRNER